MKNSELWKQYEDYTKILSDNSRQLGFGAIAICWLFKTTGNNFTFSILAALAFTVAFFIADIFQFLFGAVILRAWTRSQEKVQWEQSHSIEGEYQKPAWLDYPAYIMWWAKIIFLLTGYVFIGIHILSR